jgi:hypothetical protein
MPRLEARSAAAVLAGVLLFLTQLTSAQVTEPDGTAAATPPAASAGSQPGGAAQPKPFTDVVKEAKEIPGFFTLYRKDEKVWLAIAQNQFDLPFSFSYNIPSSIGERGLYGSQMGDSHLVVFRKIGNQIQLVAKNTRFFAQAGTPQARFVAESFSDSLLASAAAASTPHPETKAVLVEVNSLLFADIPGYLTRLETVFRMPFALDPRNTSISRTDNTRDMTGVQVQAHFRVPKLPAPPLTPPTPPTPAPPPPPQTTPDPRSLFVSFYYSFARLPETPMSPRLADERVGHFVTTRADYTEDTTPKTKVHYVNRWRLEKQDPTAVLSEPREPITYWIDGNVPGKYRKAVSDGILEWNKAFEKAGIRNALVVRQQTDKDNFDTMDARHASVRWFAGADVGFAIGPSKVDRRSGEILDADIGMSDVFARGARLLVAEDLGKPLTFDASPAGMSDFRQQNLFLSCNYAAETAPELHFGLDLLESRGLAMDGPEAEKLAQEYVKEIIMHEVGHTLGLRHNFRSSTIYTLKQIQDPAFTAVHGLTSSVMDYIPFNLAAKGEAQGEYTMSTLGPYDYLAIEYAYRPLDSKDEKAELARIAARTSTDPRLVYGTDEDAGYGNIAIGIDPEVNRFDLGSDPLEYYKKRMKLTRELWDRLEALKLEPGESYERLSRSFASGFRQLTRVAPLVAKYVGGIRHVRDRAGTDRPLYEPTPAAKQREALALVTDGLFKVNSFKLKPGLVARLSIDHFERTPNPDVSIANSVLNLQKAVLDVLLADNVAQRLLDSQDKVANPASLLKLSELYDALQDAIWSELRTGAEITPLRRNLQREHLKRLATMLVKPSAATPADGRSLQRENALQLSRQIRSALAKQKSKEAKAHLAESLATLTEAIKAPLQRAGV